MPLGSPGKVKAEDEVKPGDVPEVNALNSFGGKAIDITHGFLPVLMLLFASVPKGADFFI